MKRPLVLGTLWVMLFVLDALIALFGEDTWKRARSISRRHMQDFR